MENDPFDEQINSNSISHKINISNINATVKSSRPETPHIDLLAIRNIRKNEPDQIIKNFGSFVKQIIDTENEKFLNGEINLIEYIISKFTNVNINSLNELEKLSLKINGEFGLLNQFGQKLPNLKELRLSGSNIICITSIGTDFRNLRILQVNNCNIKDLSGKDLKLNLNRKSNFVFMFLYLLIFLLF